MPGPLTPLYGMNTGAAWCPTAPSSQTRPTVPTAPYPSPERIQLPNAPSPTPDQHYYVGWLVTHNRLWLALLATAAVAVIELLVIFTMAAKFHPTFQTVTLDGGYPVAWNPQGNVVIDSVEYQPARLRAVVESFLQDRYAYDWQDLQKINTALRLMSTDAQAAERQKLDALNLQTSVVGVRLKTTLKLDWSNFTVKPVGKGRFAITVQATALFTDAYRNTDPLNPASKPVTLNVTVQAVPATDLNPLGYVVVATGRDIL